MSEVAPEATPTVTEAATPNPETGTPAQLPDDHPLVKAFNATKDELRSAKEVAKANADAAARLAELEEANKSEAQKQAEEVERLRAENASFKQREQVATWAKEVSEETGVPADVLSGSTREELLAHAEKLKPLITPQQPDTKPGTVPTVGKSPAGVPNIPLGEQIAAAEREVLTAERGSPEWREAQGRVMALKGLQLRGASK